jgi:hypothetical protein
VTLGIENMKRLQIKDRAVHIGMNSEGARVDSAAIDAASATAVR